MRKLLVLLALALPVAAQTGPPNLSGCFAATDQDGTIGDRSLAVSCNIDSADAGYYFRVDYGYSNGSLTRRFPFGNSADTLGNGTERWTRGSDLTPGATVYFGPQISNSNRTVYSTIPLCTATCTNCGSSDDALFADDSGIDCVTGENWRVTMAAVDSAAPEDPQIPEISYDPNPPEPDTTVSTDGTCSDLTSILATAKTTVEGDGSVYRILVPPNVRCAPFQLLALSQGRIQIAPDVDPKLLPPAGTRVFQPYYPYMGLFTKDPTAPATWGSTTWTMATGARGYDFIGIRTTAPIGADLGDYPSTRMQILTPPGAGGFPSAQDMRWDRCVFDYPKSWPISHLINVTGTQNFVFKDSYLRFDTASGVTPAVFAIYLHGSAGLQLLNNTITGIVFGDSTTQETVDFRMTGNDISIPDAHSAASPSTDGIYRRFTMCLELKACLRCDITGNHFKGCRADFNPNGPAVMLSGVSPQQADIDFSYNTIKRSSGGLMLDENVSANQTRANYPTERLKIFNNLFYDLDMDYNCSGSSCSQSGSVGPMLWFSDGTVDTKISRNTYSPKRVRRPIPLRLFGHHHQGFLFNSNIAVVSIGDASFYGVRKDITAFGMLPAPAQQTGKTAWDETMIRGTSLDALSAASGNLFITGIQGASSGSYSSKAASLLASDTVSRASVAANTGLSGFISGTGNYSGNAYVGSTDACSGSPSSCPDTLNDRLALVFEPGEWQPIETYRSKGADVDLIKAFNGVTDKVVTAAAATSAVITFLAPDHDNCLVQLSPWDTNYAGTWDDKDVITDYLAVGGSRERTASFTGLSGTTKYGYRIQCKKEYAGNLTTGAPVSVAAATTLYVDPGGDDADPCSQAEPCLTIGHAADVSEPGYTIIVNDGTYGAESIDKGGRAGALLLIQAANPGAAILDGADTDTVGLTINDNVHWLRFEGLTIQEFTARGIAVGSANGPNHDITFSGMLVKDIGDTQCTTTNSTISGVVTKQTTTFFTWESSTIDNVGRLAHGSGGCDTGGNNNWRNHDHGMYLYGQHLTIRNSVFLNLDNGWPIQFPSGSAYTRTLFNTFYTANPFRDGSIVLDREGPEFDNHHHIIVGNITEATNSLLNISGDPLPCGAHPFVYLGYNLVGGQYVVSDENETDASACADFTLEGNQVSTTATFVSAPTDLELDTGSNGLADGPPAYVITDFDGNARSLTTPDLGAYEQ